MGPMMDPWHSVFGATRSLSRLLRKQASRIFLEAGLDAVGVCEAKLCDSLLPVRGDLDLVEASPGFAFTVAASATVLEPFLDVADRESEQHDDSVSGGKMHAVRDDLRNW